MHLGETGIVLYVTCIASSVLAEVYSCIFIIDKRAYNNYVQH